MRGIRFLKAWLQVSGVLLALTALKAFIDLELLYRRDRVLDAIQDATFTNISDSISGSISGSISDSIDSQNHTLMEDYVDVKIQKKEPRSVDLVIPPSPEIGSCKTKFEKIEGKTVLLGIGTGRCGTRAFSKFINQNIGTYVTHEFNHCENLNWDEAISVNSMSLVGNRYKLFIERKASIVGDVQA